MRPEFTKEIKGHLLKIWRDTSSNGQPIWLATYQDRNVGTLPRTGALDLHFWIKGLTERIESTP